MTKKQTVVLALAGLIVGATLGHSSITYIKQQFEIQHKKLACLWLEEQADKLEEAVVVLQQFCWRKK